MKLRIFFARVLWRFVHSFVAPCADLEANGFNLVFNTARAEYIVHTWVCKNQKRDSGMAIRFSQFIGSLATWASQ
jgi:hypothetical protein